MNPNAFHKLSYGLYVLSSSFEGKPSGCIINTVMQVTSTPAQISVTVNKDNYTEKTIAQSGCFAAVALTQDVSMDLIGEFGFKTSETTDKFKNFAVAQDGNGIPYLIQNAAARFSCKVVQQMDVGTHVIFVGEVTEAEVLSDSKVMTYSYYHTIKKGTTPKNAPTYQAETANAAGYRCPVCGYVVEGELPADFVCPICGQPAKNFIRI